MKRFLKENSYAVLFPILALLFSTVLFVIAKQLVFWRPHYDLSCPQDAFFPYLPWTVVVYIGSFLYWYLSFILAARQDRNRADRVFCTHMLTVIFSAVVFVIYPTTIERPVPDGPDVWDWMMRIVYWIDSPENLFPSLHCSTGWLCWVAVRHRKDMPLWARLSALPLSIAVCLSTLTTRQHVLADVISGIALCEIDWLLASIPGLRARFSRLADALLRRFEARMDQ